MTKRVFTRLRRLLTRAALCVLFPLSAQAGVATQCSATKADNALVIWLAENVKQHPSVLAAKAAVEASKFQKEAANQALYNPELELATESIDEVSTTTIGISQTLDWGDRREANIKLAKSQFNIANERLKVLEQDIALKLLAALSEYHTSERLQSVAKQRRQLMERFVRLAKQRFSYGDLTKVDIDLAKLSYAQARFNQASEQIEYIHSKQQLISLSGASRLDWPLMPVEFPKPSLQNDVDNKVRQLPQMLLALAAVESAQATMKQQVSQTVVNPTLSIHAGKEESDDVLGLTFSMPLQFRNNFKAEIAVANAQLIQAEKEANARFRELTSRYKVSIASYQLSREAWAFWQQFGAITLNDQIDLLERLWKAGELSTTDYLTQLIQALETKTAAIKQRGQLWKDWAKWQLLTGQIEQCLLKEGEGE